MDEVELHIDFLRDLSDLLKKYDAKITTEIMNDGYAGYNYEYIHIVDFKSNDKRGYSRMELPNFLD